MNTPLISGVFRTIQAKRAPISRTQLYEPALHPNPKPPARRRKALEPGELSLTRCGYADLFRARSGWAEILKMAALVAGAGLTSVPAPGLAQAKLPRTPGQILGPFYPVTTKPLHTTDLTIVPGRNGRADGEILYVSGRVLNLAGEPVRDAEIQIWQANRHGRYTHPSDDNPAPLDPNFEGFAVLKTDGDGQYRFKTIKPGGYPAGPNLIRPPHVHFR